VLGEAAASQHQVGDWLIQDAGIEDCTQMVRLANMKVMVAPIPPTTGSDGGDYSLGYVMPMTPEYATQKLGTIGGEANTLGPATSMLRHDFLDLHKRLFVDDGRVILSVNHLAIHQPPAEIDRIGD
jgi:hypothetical protein